MPRALLNLPRRFNAWYSKGRSVCFARMSRCAGLRRRERRRVPLVVLLLAREEHMTFGDAVVGRKRKKEEIKAFEAEKEGVSWLVDELLIG